MKNPKIYVPIVLYFAKKVAMMTVVITTANLQSFDCHLVSPLKI